MKAPERFTSGVRSGVALSEATVSGGILQGVTILGRVSKNRRRYTDRAMEDAARLYPGTQVHLDHPTTSEQRDRRGVRSVRSLVGKVVRAQRVGDRVRGDVQILDHEPGASLVRALTDTMPESVGLSHRVEAEVRAGTDGLTVVERVHRVLGVDLVAEPATATLAESVCRGAECGRRRYLLSEEERKLERLVDDAIWLGCPG